MKCLLHNYLSLYTGKHKKSLRRYDGDKWFSYKRKGFVFYFIRWYICKQSKIAMCFFKSKILSKKEAKNNMWEIAKTIPVLSHALYKDICICDPDKEEEWKQIASILSQATQRIEKLCIDIKD